MRKSPTSWQSADTLFRSVRGAKSRGRVLLCNNTYLVPLGHDYGIQYHSTIVVLYRLDGSIRLAAGCWIDSSTTRERIEAALPRGVGCGQNGGIQYLAVREPFSGTKAWDGNWQRVVWQNGTVLHPIEGGFLIDAPEELEDADEAARLRRNALARDRYQANRDGTPLQIERFRHSSWVCGRGYSQPVNRPALIQTSDAMGTVEADFLIVLNGANATIIPKSKRAAGDLSTDTRTVCVDERFSVSRETAVQAAAVAVENAREVVVEDA